MKMLVAIASYGTGNDRYLARLIQEFHSMSFPVDIVVLSNLEKEIGSGVELVVGLPYGNPWTLPFPHKKIFADRLNNYDLFLYCEDDMLVTERNIRAFLEVNRDLPEKEIPGFLRFEESGQDRNYPEFHGPFHWDTASLRRRGPYTTARFTNEHAGCYLLTQAQLRSAIKSGGFLVGPHEGRYDLLCTAATDPYTQCGFEKVICVSRIDDFVIHHLPNKYMGTEFGIDEKEFRRQTHVLMELAEKGEEPRSIFSTETKLRGAVYSKNYYERPHKELATILPPEVKTVLSIGCGWGAAEAWLTEQGLTVTAIPLDPVVPGCAGGTGVELVRGDLESARIELAGRTFDCLLLINVLHLLENPPAMLSSFKNLLSGPSVVITLVPNMARPYRPWRREKGDVVKVVNFQESGAHFVSHRVVRKWFRQSGMRVKKTVDVLTPRAQMLSDLVFGLADSRFSSEFLSIAEPRG
ncbi:MAG TPA: methyltransferase domain-containing protein [Terracidiphilus sp.]|nr:methyltransferase domain-containing protein [Terracidiphilus sp.]